jgi:hypothetical protein
MSSRKIRIDDSHLLDFHVQETPEGLVVSARIDRSAGDSEEVVQSIISQLESLGSQLKRIGASEVGDLTYTHRFLMSTDSEITQADALAAIDELSLAGSEVLESADLIPIPPERPSGKISVRLRKAGRDKPLPAENPWAE